MAEAFGVAASALAVIELSAKVVKTCAQYTKDVANARQDIQRLEKEVASLSTLAQSIQNLSKNTTQRKVAAVEKTKPILDESQMRLTALHAKLDPGKRGKAMSRIGLRALKWPFSSQDVEKTLADLARLTQAISLAMQVDQMTILLSLEQKTSLAKLDDHIAAGAAYDSHADEHSPQCLKDTRTDVLREIIEWVRDPSSKAVYWLNGMAGTGKSTISRTIASRFSQEDDFNTRLGATFFFKRGEGDRDKMSKFFPTITSQFAQHSREIAEHVRGALDADPLLLSKTMRTQFERLIVDPVSKISIDSSRTFLFVIDALDECEREEDVRFLIKLLSGVPRLSSMRLKFFLTSRPELPIRLGFNAINGTYQDFVLHRVEETIIAHDLTVYLKYRLGQIRKEYNNIASLPRRLPESWPSEMDLDTLVKMAIPLFIFATTMCRFIGDGRVGNPDEQLREVLRYQTKSQESQLDATYLPVLHQMTAGINNERAQRRVVERFDIVVGSIVTLADPLSATALAQLLDLSPDTIDDALRTLHSVLYIPQIPEQPIRLLHLSFRDFLVDPKRQGHPFWVNEEKVHQQLAGQCLRILNNSLTNDICSVKAPGTPASSMSVSEVRTCISPELQYACRFWTYHLCESLASDLDTAGIWKFLSLHFLQWLEVLSWIGRLPESLGMVQSLQSKIPEDCQNIKDFLSDSIRFIQAMGTNIQNAPLQAYSSSLVFSPTRSIIRTLYQENISRDIGLKPQMPLFWGERQATLEGHTNYVNSVAFSPDGQQIASASDDKTVILWSAATGERQATLEGHTNWVNSVAFSPDGQQIASASGDETVILWSAATGERQATLEGHANYVSSVAFSPDGQQIASASGDETVILWSAATGERQATLEGHANYVSSVAFSPDGHQIASASGDKTVILWSAATGERQATLEGHTNYVNSVAFSPDGQQIASASGDKTVILWSAATGERQATLEGHAGGVSSVAFSPDGQQIASASGDKTVILWSAATGERQATLEGHTNYVSSVAFSPDGQQIASASGDKTVILWSAATGERQATLEGHANYVNSVAFSPDGQQIASASGDKTVILWSAATGERQATLEGHANYVSSVAFSPDGQQIASASGDETVILWSAATGERQATLEGHAGGVNSVAFSPDGQQIASASHDETVILWSAATGERQAILQTGYISDLRFNSAGTHILSDRGGWDITSRHRKLPVELSPFRPDDADSSGCGVSSDKCWITKDGQHVLWLPVEYRPVASAISGKSIVWGCSSGRVLILRII